MYIYNLFYSLENNDDNPNNPNIPYLKYTFSLIKMVTYPINGKYPFTVPTKSCFDLNIVAFAYNDKSSTALLSPWLIIIVFQIMMFS